MSDTLGGGSGAGDTPIEGGSLMLDVLYLGVIVGFLALSWGLVELCDRLQAKGTRS
jgi:hypothetical protein